MKKILLAAIGILALTLSACGASADSTPVKSGPAPQVSAPATDAPVMPAAATAPAAAEPAPASNVSFAKDVQPILNNYCVKCHGVDDIKEGLNLTSYDNLIKGSFNGAVIAPGNADDSLLVDLVSKGKMPKRGAKPSAAEIDVIVNWINAGAPNN